MSILLEALRKSEKSQLSREVPTIHSEVPSSPASRSLKSVGLVILLALTLIACGWFVWKQYKQPSDAVQATTAGQLAPVAGDKSTSTAQPEPKKLPALSRSNRRESALNSQNTGAGAAQKSTASDTRNSNRVAGERTPMESYRASEQDKVNHANLVAGPVAGQSVNTNGGRFPSAVKEVEGHEGASGVSEASDKPYQPDAPAMLGYWDLPDSIRANVPEVSFSVLVYDKNPENRFVLVNGERLTEGDAHQPGLIVKEIRRDGVVFSYRLYNFLIEN